jgi:hypothetical protein
MDVKAGADTVLSLLPGTEVFSKLSPLLGNVTLFAAVVIGVVLLLSLTGIGRRAWKRLEETILSNWRLALLGATGIVLSLASGYTTWDGMRNFTGEPLLSGMITFGIQGVMLIVAWLIGESFATGMSERAPDGQVRRPADAAIGMMLGLVLGGIVFVWLLRQTGAATWSVGMIPEVNVARFADVSMYFAMALILVAIIVFNRGSGLSLPYIQSTRVIIRNAMLWVMFLATMATSVFFSFDSLFTAIFPQSERQRAAELRAQNQVAGIVADIGTTIESRSHTAREELFRSPGWTAYDAHLANLAKASQGAEAEIERFFVQQMEARRRGIAEQQERIATAVSGQAGLVSRKTALTDELARIKGERPGLAADLAEKKTELENRAKGVDAKRVEAMAEERGAEGTLKVGKGQVYRQRMDELGKLQDAYKIQEERARDAQKRVSATDTRIAQLERELAAVDGDIAKLRGEASTAEQRIKVAEDVKVGEDGPKVDPARVRAAFEGARADFRQQPDAARLGALQQLCNQLYGALAATPATRERVRTIDCDPKQASEAAAVVFGLNAGIKAFETGCAGGDRLAQHKTADDLFGLARKCLADSGLPSKETDQLRAKINFIELSRDDKAHRFVVTWNAFNDGNRLAYLALAIAIAIDALVFMSGLFGANAVRSPLSGIPREQGMNARELEAIIENALLPDRFAIAKLVLGALHPITNDEGYVAEVDPGLLDPESAARVREVLNAGSTIGAVRREGRRYLVRAELFQFLSVVAKRAFEASMESHKEDVGQRIRLDELEKFVMVALLPNVSSATETVLSHLHPIDETHGFMSEVFLKEIEKDDPANARAVRNVLNVGAAHSVVQRQQGDDGRYFIHADLYKTLLRLRARMLLIGEPHAGALDHQSRPAIAGGHLSAHAHVIPSSRHGTGAPRGIAQDGTRKPPPPRAPPVEDPAAVRWEFWSRMIASLGLDPMATSQRVNTREIHDALSGVSQALASHAEGNRRLRQLIHQHEEIQTATLADEYSLLRDETASEPGKRQILEAVDKEIEDLLPLLILFPEIGLIGFLVEKLERAAAPDDGLLANEQLLLDRLRHANSLLHAGGHLSEAVLWRQVSDVISGAPVPLRPAHRDRHAGS